VPDPLTRVKDQRLRGHERRGVSGGHPGRSQGGCRGLAPYLYLTGPACPSC